MFMASLQDAFAIYVCFLILAIAASFGNQLPTSAFSGSIQRCHHLVAETMVNDYSMASEILKEAAQVNGDVG
jgi:hypothetical protein